jgi:hypothetical protein
MALFQGMDGDWRTWDPRPPPPRQPSIGSVVPTMNAAGDRRRHPAGMTERGHGVGGRDHGRTLSSERRLMDRSSPCRPSAGPPPWYVYEFDPEDAYAVMSEAPGGATRWTF